MQLSRYFTAALCAVSVTAHAHHATVSRRSSPSGGLSSAEVDMYVQLILAQITSAADCGACEGALGILKVVADLGDDAFDDVFIALCDISGAEDPDVCQGVVNAEGPIIAYALRNLDIGSHTSTLLCSNLFGLCAYPAVRPFKLSFPKPKPKKSAPKPSGQKPLSVVHISDTHVDLSYETGASYNCTKPICCRPYTAADAPGNNSYPAGPFGNHACDAPVSLEKNMFAAIESIVNPDFSIFTGDVVAHDIWLVNRSEVVKDLDVTYRNMAKLNLVYPALGNHDVNPVNAFAPTQLAAQAKNAQYAYNTMSKDWMQWIGPAAAASVKNYGSYSVLYNNKLRVISFNSVFYYVLNFWAYQEPMPFDPSSQFQWLISELQAAEDAGQRAWLISHIPSGSSDYFRDYSHYFNEIVNRYSATIAALFYGHTHIDQFEVGYSNYNMSQRTAANALSMSYITPSMTPTSGSPSFRVYSIDPVTFAVLDYTQYIANISSPEYQQKPVWTKYYSAKETYGALLSPPLTDAAAELTPAFWHNVTAAFQTNDAAFQAYIERQTRGYNGPGNCTGSCKQLAICGLRSAESAHNCAVATPGLHFSRRDDLVHDIDHADECGESRVRKVFLSLTRSAAARQ